MFEGKSKRNLMSIQLLSYLTVHLKGELFCMGGSPSSQDVQDIREAVAAPEYEL